MANEETGIELSNNGDGDHNEHCKMLDRSTSQLLVKL